MVDMGSLNMLWKGIARDLTTAANECSLNNPEYCRRSVRAIANRYSDEIGLPYFRYLLYGAVCVAIPDERSGDTRLEEIYHSISSTLFNVDRQHCKHVVTWNGLLPGNRTVTELRKLEKYYMDSGSHKAVSRIRSLIRAIREKAVTDPGYSYDRSDSSGQQDF